MLKYYFNNFFLIIKFTFYFHQQILTLIIIFISYFLSFILFFSFLINVDKKNIIYEILFITNKQYAVMNCPILFITILTINQ